MKIRIIGAALLLALSAAPAGQTLSPEASDLLKRLAALGDQAKVLLERDRDVTIVKTAAEFSAALSVGGHISIAPGSTFEGERFTVAKSGTVVDGHGATLRATAGPALHVPPGIDDVSIADLMATSSWPGGVIQCGDNGPTQTTPEQVPQRITFTNVVVPTHRGKRGFEIHCSARIIDSKALDVWATSLADSQGLWVGNTCGPVTVLRGVYVAASENILVGGDSMKIPCVQTDIDVDGVELTKPESWHTDRVNRGVKNLYEVKSGLRVTLRNAKLSGSWKSGQDGWAIVVTPKNGSYIKDVLIENVTADRCGGGVQTLGKDYNSVTPQALSGVVVRNSAFDCRDGRAAYGGRGIFTLMSGGVLDVTVDNVTFIGDGNAIVQSDTPAGSPQGPLVIRNSRMTLGTYGVLANGANYGNAPTGSYVGRELRATFEGNTFATDGMSTAGLTAFKRNFPNNNAYVSREEFDRIVAAGQ